LKAIISRTKAPDGFARALRTVRVYKGIPQEELATRAGYSPGTVSNWEAGHSEPKDFDRQNLAQALGVPHQLMVRLSMPGDPLVELTRKDDDLPDDWVTTRYTQAEAAAEAGISMSLLQKYQKMNIVKPIRKAGRPYYSRFMVTQLMDARKRLWKERAQKLSDQKRRKDASLYR